MITKLSRFSILIVLSLFFISLLVGMAELNSWLEPQSAAAVAGPQLSISSNIPATPNSTVVVPVIFTSNGADIASTVFSIDYDETWLSFDETLPNAIEFTLPADFAGQCAPDQVDPDGEIDCFILDPLVPLASLPDGVVLNLTLRTKNPSPLWQQRQVFQPAAHPPRSAIPTVRVSRGQPWTVLFKLAPGCLPGFTCRLSGRTSLPHRLRSQQ